MRINVYTEELENGRSQEQFGKTDLPICEIVTAEYISSRTGELMKNWGLRIYLKSHPDLHYIKNRDDDRSAVTFWCGSKEKNIFDWIDSIRKIAYSQTLDTWHKKTELIQNEAEIAEAERNK